MEFPAFADQQGVSPGGVAARKEIQQLAPRKRKPSGKEKDREKTEAEVHPSRSASSLRLMRLSKLEGEIHLLEKRELSSAIHTRKENASVEANVITSTSRFASIMFPTPARAGQTAISFRPCGAPARPKAKAKAKGTLCRVKPLSLHMFKQSELALDEDVAEEGIDIMDAEEIAEKKQGRHGREGGVRHCRGRH